MDIKDFNKIATITQRVVTCNIYADAAKIAIENLKFSQYEGLFSPEELAALNAALKVVEDVRSRTTVRDAMAHANDVLKIF